MTDQELTDLLFQSRIVSFTAVWVEDRKVYEVAGQELDKLKKLVKSVSEVTKDGSLIVKNKCATGCTNKCKGTDDVKEDSSNSP